MWKREVKKEDLNNLRDARNLLKFLWKSNNAPIYIMDNHLAAHGVGCKNVMLWKNITSYT